MMVAPFAVVVTGYKELSLVLAKFVLLSPRKLSVAVDAAAMLMPVVLPKALAPMPARVPALTVVAPV